VAESTPAQATTGKPGSTSSASRRNLALRVVSALVLAPLAITAAWSGGWVFAVFWGVAALGVWWEWASLVSAAAARLVMLTGAGALVLALGLAGSGRILTAVIVIVLGAAASNVVAPSGRGAWAGAGLLYAAAPLLAPIILRQDPEFGFAAILFLFAIVWGTDILGYVVGRAVGGPKLWPRVSPNKTWSGALAGAVASLAVGAGFAHAIVTGNPLCLALLGVVLSIVAQAGDLLESAIKRRFGTKDASHLIPGHGGLMDRLDGFIAAVLAAAIIGSFRAGLDSSGQGLLLWTQ
jgi:phosphatidate cytidylyltransferase